MRTLLVLVLVLVLVAGGALPAAADHRDREDRPRPRPTPAAPGELQANPVLPWLLFAVIVYMVFFVPAPPLSLQCVQLSPGVIVCFPV